MKDWDKFFEMEIQKNKEILLGFEKWLKSKLYTEKTINNHIGNIDFFANHYLLQHEIIPIEKGALLIGGFLDDYLIRKTNWASKNSINENISSFKKFYTFLNEIGELSNTELQKMKELIKTEKEYWMENYESYENGNEDFY
jgi:hypothetical protein